jgi:hypothetical protein
MRNTFSKDTVKFLIKSANDLYLKTSCIDVEKYLESKVEDSFQLSLFSILLDPSNIFRVLNMCRTFLNTKKFEKFENKKSDYCLNIIKNLEKISPFLTVQGLLKIKMNFELGLDDENLFFNLLSYDTCKHIIDLQKKIKKQELIYLIKNTKKAEEEYFHLLEILVSFIQSQTEIIN